MSSTVNIERFILDELLMGSRESIGHDESLISSGVIDSLALLRLIGFVEDRFGVVLEDEEVVAENFETINVIAALVQNKQ